MEQIKKITFNNKQYNIKYSLSNDEYANLIATTYSSIDASELPHFIAKSLVLNKAIVKSYTGIDDTEIDDVIDEFDDGKKLIDIIEENIYYTQYCELKQAVDEAVEFLIQLKFHKDSIESKINEIMDRVLKFSDHFPVWAEFITDLLKDKDGSKLVEAAMPLLLKMGLGKAEA